MQYFRRLVLITTLFAGWSYLAGVAAEPTAVNHPRYIWWQAEKPTATNFPEHCWLSASTPREKAKLSGGQWLAFSGKATTQSLYAVYTVRELHGGQYDFWVRKCWQYGPFKWHFDNKPWQVCTNHEVLK